MKNKKELKKLSNALNLNGHILLRNTIKSRGITLVALVVTIVVLLILAGITVTMLFGENGIIKKAQEAKEATERNQQETQQGLQDLVDQMGSILNGVNSGETDAGKIAMLDTGTNIAIKIRTLVADGNIPIGEELIANLSIDGIKKYTGTPDISSMTDANIVSWTEGYELYKQNPEAFENIVPAGMELCPIYMWFEESGETKIRDTWGSLDLTTPDADLYSKEVSTGTLYWWCETSNVYLNSDSAYMFFGLPYLSDISGMQNVKTDYVTNISYMLASLGNHSLTNVNALSNWNMSSVNDMRFMFQNCSSLTDISGLENWDTSSVKNMSCMFAGHDTLYMGLSDISYLSKWDVSNVEDMREMFWYCEITDLYPLQNWNVGKVTNMSDMFCDCDELSDASDINNWDITSVTDFGNMFFGCPTHPEFTKVTGTWDTDGTFNPEN